MIDYKNYLDYASYSPVKKNVLNYFLEKIRYCANPSSMHSMGYKNQLILNNANKNIKNIYNCNHDDKIIFTSGATEANNTAFSLFSKYIEQYIIGSTEHPSVSKLVEYKNYKVVMVKDGYIDINELNNYLSNNKKTLVSIMMLNNETGAITKNLQEAINLTHKYNGIFHSDCAQSAIKIPINFNNLKIDMISLSSAKVGAISGTGALIIKNQLLLKMKIKPLINGSGYQYNIRSGTPPIALISAFAYALEIGINNMNEENKKFKIISNNIINSLKTNKNFYYVSNNRCNSILYISNSKTPKLEQTAYFDQNNIYISPGTACNKGGGVYSDKFIMSQCIISNNKIITASDNKSHDFQKIKHIYNTGIRLSFGHFTTAADINTFLSCWKNINK